MVRFITLLVLAVVFLSLAQPLIIWNKTNQLIDVSTVIHGRAVGNVNIYLLPTVTINNTCSAGFNQSTSVLDYTYHCQLGVVNPGNISVEFGYMPHGIEGLNVSVNSSGYMTIWGDQRAVGNNTITLFLSDPDTDMLLAFQDYEFEVFDINDPPFLVSNIPSFNIPVNTVISAFDLDDHFDDPDNDPLTYAVVGNSNFDVTIDGDSSVSFFVSGDFCGDEDVYFTATDNSTLPPQNYTVDSNMVTLNAVCPEPDSPPGAPTPPSAPDRCTPEWRCERWGRCYPNGTQSRRCIDLNGCDPNNLERIFWQECEYIPDPEVEDPEEEDVVEEEEEEEPFTPDRERPVLVGEDERDFVGVIVAVLLVLAVLLFVYALFKKEILGLYARLSWWMTRKARKELLLSEPEKDELLGLVSDAEKHLSLDKSSPDYKSSDEIVQNVLGAQRLYLKYVFNLDLEFTNEDLERVADKRIVHDSLRTVLRLLFKKLSYLEQNKVLISRIHVAVLLEELRQMVLNTSKYAKKDYGFSVKEQPVTGSALQKCVAVLYNAMIALQFREMDLAESKYISLLKFYEELPEEQKSLVYDDTSRLYHNIKYVLSWA